MEDVDWVNFIWVKHVEESHSAYITNILFFGVFHNFIESFNLLIAFENLAQNLFALAFGGYVRNHLVHHIRLHILLCILEPGNLLRFGSLCEFLGDDRRVWIALS